MRVNTAQSAQMLFPKRVIGQRRNDDLFFVPDYRIQDRALTVYYNADLPSYFARKLGQIPAELVGDYERRRHAARIYLFQPFYLIRL